MRTASSSTEEELSMADQVRQLQVEKQMALDKVDKLNASLSELNAKYKYQKELNRILQAKRAISMLPSPDNKKCRPTTSPIKRSKSRSSRPNSPKADKFELEVKVGDDDGTAIEKLNKQVSNLFNRLAVEKQKNVELHAISEQNKNKVSVISHHVDKLTATLKVCSIEKQQYEKEIKQLKQRIQFARTKESNAIKSKLQSLEKLDSISKQQDLKNEHLDLLGKKLMHSHHVHHNIRKQAKNDTDKLLMQIQHLNDQVWCFRKQAEDSNIAKLNCLLSTTKLIESCYGQTPHAVVDLQECGLDDVGAMTVSRALKAAAARYFQACDERLMNHATAMEAWNKRKYSNDLIDKEDIGPPPEIAPEISKPPLLLLNLSFNRITDVGLAALCEAFKGSPFIREVDLRANQISDQGLGNVLHCLEYNSLILGVDLSGNQIKECHLLEQEQVNLNRYQHQHGKATTKRLGAKFHVETSSPEDSLFQPDAAKRRFRSRSAPPRMRYSDSDSLAEKDESKWSIVRNKYPKSTKFVKFSNDVIRANKHVFHRKQGSRSATARIALDSLTLKQAERLHRKIRNRPLTAYVSAEGGDEASTIDTKNAKVNNKLTATGNIRYTSGRVNQRLKQCLADTETKGGNKKDSFQRLQPLSILEQVKLRRVNKQVADDKSLQRAKLSRENAAFKSKPRDSSSSYASLGYQVMFTHVEERSILQVLKMLDHGMDINSREIGTGLSVLTKSIQFIHDPEFLKVCINKNADVNCIDNRGYNAVQYAIEHKKDEMIEVLIRYGCNKDYICRDKDNTIGTALHFAVSNNNYQAVVILLRLKCDKYIRNHEGKLAVELCQDEEMKSLFGIF